MATHPRPAPADAGAEPAAPDEPVDLDPLAELRPLGDRTVRERVDDALTQLRRRPARVLGPAVAVLAVLGVGWWLLRPPGAPPIEATLPLAPAGTGGAPDAGGDGGPVPSPGGAPAGAVATTAPAPGELVVQAAGAVAEPGVYRVPPGARVDDVVRSAGGLAPDADADRVNLAAPVGDGERLWVPRRGEEAPPEVVAGTGAPPVPTPGPGGSAGEGGGAGAAAGPVDLNRASAAELEALPGVGPATAAAIVAHREQHGPFATVDDLLDVRGIGEAKLEQIRPLAAV